MDINAAHTLTTAFQSRPSPGAPALPGTAAPWSSSEYFSSIRGNHVTTYEVTPDGQVTRQPDTAARSPRADGMEETLGSVGDFITNNMVTRRIRQFIVPDNMPASVSDDYTSVSFRVLSSRP
jgi:hypothetical protein